MLTRDLLRPSHARPLAKAKGSSLVGHEVIVGLPRARGEHGFSGRRWKEAAMTKKRDLKRRIRERQEKTGESYVTARRQVLSEDTATPAVAPAAPASGAIPVIEMISLTAEAERLGMQCRVAIESTLAE